MADNPGDQNEDPSALRKNLDAANAKLRELTEKMAITEAGLKLSDRQKRTLLRDLHEDKLDVTGENILTVAKEYGWEKTEAAAPTAPTAPTGSSPSPNGQGFLEHVDPVTGDLLPNLTPDQYRQIAMQAQFAATGGMQTRDEAGNEMTWEKFDGLMKGAESQADQMALIQRYGAAFNMMDASLVD